MIVVRNNNKIHFLSNTLEIIKKSEYNFVDISWYKRLTLLYKRDNQYVFREIIKLELFKLS